MTTDARNGVTASARPSSSSTTPSSTKVYPAPPYSSGTASPARPSSPHIFVHIGRSWSSPSAISRRTTGSGEKSARNSRTTDCSSSCSLSSAKRTADLRGSGFAGGPRAERLGDGAELRGVVRLALGGQPVAQHRDRRLAHPLVEHRLGVLHRLRGQCGEAVGERERVGQQRLGRHHPVGEP